jgi:hypothetical protein
MKFRAAGPLSCLLFLYVLRIGLLAQIAPNSDNNYLQLRNIALQPTGTSVQNVTLKRGASTFRLNSGVLCFVAPVNNKVTGAVFVGEGKLLLDPPAPWERAMLSALSREKEYAESFDQLVLRFTDNTYEELKAAGKPSSSSCDPTPLRNSEKASRKELHNNLDARILQDVLSPEPGGLIVAFVHSKHYEGKTIFTIDPHGAPDVYPEEISLETYNECKYGIWAAFHYTAEYANGTAKSSQKNGVIQIDRHRQERPHRWQGRGYDGFPSAGPEGGAVPAVPFLVCLQRHGPVG